MLEKIKQELFTVPGFVITLIHVFFVVGFITCWIAVNTQILGKDPLSVLQRPEPTSTPTNTRKR